MAKKPNGPRPDPMEVGGADEPEAPVAVRAKPAPFDGVPAFSVAWVQAIEPLSIPGMTRGVAAAPRIDPLEPEWQGWRIVVAGPSILLIAPKAWPKGIIDGTGGLGEFFQPLAEAHGWEGPEDVRQVFEIPRSKVMIRYLVSESRGADFPDAALAGAVRERVLAAPDEATRAIFEAKLRAEEEEKAEEERARARAAAKLAARAPKPAPGKSAAAAKKRVVDDEAGMGDEGPEDDED